MPANVKKNGSHSVPAEPLFGRMRRQARSEQVPLRTIAPRETDQMQLLSRFYTLSGYAEPDIVRENDDRFDKSESRRAELRFLQKGLIDFQ